MKERIKILFFIDSYRIGGMHKQVLYLIKHIDKELFEPIMCTSSHDGGLREEFERTGCRLYNLKWRRRLDPMTVVRLIKTLKIVSPDIIFINEANSLLYYRIARFLSKKQIIQIGSFRALTFWQGHKSKIKMIVDNIFSRWLYSSSVQVIVNSKALKDHYSKIVNAQPEKPIQVIYNGSDFNFPVSKSVLEIRSELGIMPEDPVIIMVARLDPWKDFETVLNAAKIVVERKSFARFLLLGDGEQRIFIEQSIKEKKLTENVFMIGEKNDIYNYINASDISVLSTRGEGFSNSIMESMALAKPVIATNVGGNAETLGDSNDSGILVSPNSPHLFAESILLLIEDENLRKSIGISAKKRVQELCSLRTYVSSYEKIFIQSIEVQSRIN